MRPSGSVSTTEGGSAPTRRRGSLAALGGGSYLALVVWVATLAGCRPAARPTAPERGGFAPIGAAEFAGAAARTLPGGSEVVSVRWRFRDPSLEVSGRGAVRVTPPDSLRVDVRGPLGFGRGTLVLTGTSAWADPEALVRQVMPGRHFIWAMLGVLRAPDSALTFEAAGDAARRFLRVAEPDGASTVFELRGDTLVGAVRMREDRVVGRLTLARDGGGRVAHADAEDLERNARLEFNIQSRTPSSAFPAGVWRHP